MNQMLSTNRETIIWIQFSVEFQLNIHFHYNKTCISYSCKGVHVDSSSVYLGRKNSLSELNVVHDDILIHACFIDFYIIGLHLKSPVIVTPKSFIN